MHTMIDNLKVSGTNWDFIRNTKHYMLGNHEMMPLTNISDHLEISNFFASFPHFPDSKEQMKVYDVMNWVA